MRTARKKKEEAKTTGIIADSMRGKHLTRPHKYPEIILKLIRAHIESFSVVESHYCRESTQRKFLDPGLSVLKMLRMLNSILRSQKLDLEISEQKYREIFNTEYNLGFYSPLKDKCELCSVWKNYSPEMKANKQEDYQLHLKNNNIVKKLLKESRQLAKSNSSVKVIDYDLQKTLLTPKCAIGPTYYLCKLKLWNFTIYDYGSKGGCCHLWNETIGSKGSNEIASFLYAYYTEHAQDGTAEIITYSDNCGGQNKCQNVFSMNMIAATKLNIKITQR